VSSGHENVFWRYRYLGLVVVTGAATTFTIGGSTTSATSGTPVTFTFTYSDTAPRKEPDPSPKKEPVDVLACLRGAPLPRPMPPRVFGTCERCMTHMAMDAFGGRCSVCGGRLLP